MYVFTNDEGMTATVRSSEPCRMVKLNEVEKHRPYIVTIADGSGTVLEEYTLYSLEEALAALAADEGRWTFEGIDRPKSGAFHGVPVSDAGREG